MLTLLLYICGTLYYPLNQHLEKRQLCAMVVMDVLERSLVKRREVQWRTSIMLDTCTGLLFSNA
jgi:hypothetical protein